MSATGNRHAAALAPFLLSARHLRQTLAQINAPNEPRHAKAAVVKHADYPTIERIVAAFIALESEAVKIVNEDASGGCSTDARNPGMAALAKSAVHDRFLTVSRKAILDLKSKSHKRLQDRLAEYINHPFNRSPKLLAEIGRALSTALLVI